MAKKLILREDKSNKLRANKLKLNTLRYIFMIILLQYNIRKET